MNLLKLMHKNGVDRMHVSLINGEPHPSLIALADELEAHWKKTVIERDEYAEELREQISKLTKERDEAIANEGRVCGDCDGSGWLENRTEGRYPCTCMTEAEPYQLLEQQLAALAEQNEKMREALCRVATALAIPHNGGVVWALTRGDFDACYSAHNLPDLATPTLNRIKAEAYREAAIVCDEAVMKWEGPWKNAANTLVGAIRAKADELEQSDAAPSA